MLKRFRTDWEKSYFAKWQKIGKKGNPLKAYGITPSGNHYNDYYHSFKEINKKLFPYNFINEKSTVVACGCVRSVINIGHCQPLIFSTIAKEVIVFEPEPKNIEVIKNYIKKYQIKNITLIEKAVWKENTSLSFTSIPNGPGGNKIGKAKSSLTTEVIKVPAVALDSLSLPPIDFVHLTINASEKEALEGAKELLKKGPDVAIALINKKHDMYSNRHEAMKVLLENDYTLGLINATPTPWAKHNFAFAIGCKKIEKLIERGFV